MKKILIFLLIVISTVPSFAQRIQTSTNFVLGLPQGSLKGNVADVGYGIGGVFLTGIRETPFLLGFKIDYLILGSVRHRAVSDQNELTIKATTNSLLAHFVVRAQRNKGLFKPYAESVIGINSLRTQLTSSGRVSQTIGFGLTGDDTDLAFSYGLGAGTFVTLKKPSRASYYSGTRQRGTFLDIRFNYLFSSNVDFLKKDSIQINEGVATFEETHTKVNQFVIYLGLVFGL